MKLMSLIEMDGFLKGKCIPRDLKVNETNAEYLVRKFAEAEAKISALSEDQQRAIESIKQADSAVKLAHEKFSALAAENAGLKTICDDRRRFIMNGVQMGYIKVPTAETAPDLETIRIAISPQKPIPATDAFLAEVRAQGVEMIREHPSIKLCSLTHICDELAAQLRKGGNQ
ncbi:TPA: eae-like domain protein [Escherichia coli]|nr:eae-like domain protein [Escherichia coli]